MNYIQQFHDAIRASGIEAPEYIQADASIHRFSSNGRRGDNAGWYILYDDGIPAGIFGCWRTGLSQSWKADIGCKYSPMEMKIHQQKLESMRQQRKTEKKKKQRDAAIHAEQIWHEAQPVINEHAYLVTKRINPYEIRQQGSRLLIPMYDTGQLCNIQQIWPDGKKRFLKGGKVKGCHFPLGERPVTRLLICEGYATGCSLHEATGHSLVVAFNAGNLKPVAQIMRRVFPDIQITIAADNDIATPGNPGLTKAREAAAVIDGNIIYPDFSDLTETGSDFNDYLLLGGDLTCL